MYIALSKSEKQLELAIDGERGQLRIAAFMKERPPAAPAVQTSSQYQWARQSSCRATSILGIQSRYWGSACNTELCRGTGGPDQSEFTGGGQRIQQRSSRGGRLEDSIQASSQLSLCRRSLGTFLARMFYYTATTQLDTAPYCCPTTEASSIMI